MNLQRPLITGIFWALLFTTACRQAPASHSVQREAPIFHWDSLPALIPFVGDTVQYGLGGVFAGTHHGVCILAGGTNFRGQPFWQGGTKHWYPHIMVFDPDEGTWQQQDITLPRRLSYGVAISTSEGMFLIGGRDARHISRKVYLLRYDEAQKQVLIDSLSDLPLPLCFMSGARVGDAIYLAGGMDSLGGTLQKHFYRLSLKGNLKQNRWEKLSPWQGAARLLPTVVAQSDGRRECLFLFGGQFPRKGQPNEYLSDAYRYNPDTGEWTQIADIQDAEGGKKPLFASLGAKVGSSHVALFGGVDGSINRQLEQLQLDLATAKDSFEIRRLKDRQKDLLTHHPGFYRKVLIYHSITDRWREGEEMPYPACITTTAFWMDNQLIIPSGEISPGRRSPRVYKIALAKQEGQMSVLDYSLLVLYALVLLGMGGYFAKRQHSTEDYFRGGGRIPWWAAALSLFGTGLSAITFMAVPAKTFATNWAYLVLSLSIVLVPPVVSKVFIPAYRKYNISSAFQYLRLRFNRWVQLIGAATFLLFQLGRVGIILYLPALALHVVLGVNLYWCIGLVGLVSLFYTFMGGIEAVIWTDVFQVIVLVGGAIWCLLWMVMQVDGGMVELVLIGLDKDKFAIFDMTFDVKQATFWVVLVGGFFTHLITYGTDQTMVQRYLTTSSTEEAQKSIWLNALLAIPVVVLFFFIGTALFGYYSQYPAALPVGVSNDAVFPSFIISELPAGIPGLMIAAIFAAAMSSVSSSINSAATVYAVDCHRQYSSVEMGLGDARNISLLFGLLATGFAMLLASSEVKSIWDEFLKIIGLLTGGLGGIFLLGMLSKHATGRSALLALLLSAVIQYWVSSLGLVHVLLYSVTGFVSAFVMGWVLGGMECFFTRDEPA